MLVKGYFIRHLKRGVLTERVYLAPPSEETLRAVCGATDVTAGLVRTAETIVDFPEDTELEPVLAPPPEPVSVGSGNKFKVIVGGTGIVTPPK